MSHDARQSDEPVAPERFAEVVPERFAEVVIGLEEELDWALLGRLYCEEGGEGFFTAEAVEALRETGLRMVGDLAPALERSRGRRSLYVGAAVAELVPALAESLVLGRRVVLVNLPGPEADELNRGLTAVGERTELRLPRVRVGELAALARSLGGPFGHVWMTSVLSDPERFPGLHDRLYGRGTPRSRTNKRARRDLAEARELVAAAAALVRAPAVWTTTDEELEIVPEVLAELGLRLEVPEVARLSAVVGDAVRHCRVVR